MHARQFFVGLAVVDWPAQYVSTHVLQCMWTRETIECRDILVWSNGREHSIHTKKKIAEKEIDIINPFLQKAPATKKNYNKVLWNPMPMASQMPPVARRSCYAP